MTADPTEERIRGLAPTRDDSDWADVVARARVAPAPDVRPPRRRRRLPTAVALAAGAAVLLALTAAWLRSDDAPSLVDRALAAVSTGPVLHAALEIATVEMVLTPDGDATEFSVVDLATGDARTVTTRHELWWDPERQLLRGRTSIGGTVQWEWLQSPRGTQSTHGRDDPTSGPPTADPALAGFFRGYARALEDGTATRAGTEIRDGRTVEWLRFPAREGGNSSEIALDVESGRALYLRTVCPRCSTAPPTYRIDVLEGVERAAADFTPPRRRDRRSTGRYADGGGRDIVLGEASKLLGTTALWGGPAVGSLKLSRVEYRWASRHTALPTTPENEVGRGRGLVFLYGVPGSGRRRTPARSLAIMETADYRFGPGNFDPRGGGPPLTLAGGPVPPEGKVALSSLGRDYGWSAQLRKGELFVEVHAPSRVLALQAARALTPVPEGG